MFRRRHVAKSRREYELRPAPESLFERRPVEFRCADRKPGQREVDERETRTVLVLGNQAPYLLTRLEELRLLQADIPALTVTADPSNCVAVAGSSRPDWSLRFCAQGEGETEDEARERLHQMSMTRAGGTVSLTSTHLLSADPTCMGRGHLVVDAPADARIVIHASYAAVEICDMKGPVRVAATHGRTTILNTTGQVDAIGLVVDFAGSGGRVTLSAEAEINMKLSTVRFDGTLLAWAQRSVRTLVPPGFVTPFRAIVSRPEDFVCRAEFCSQVMREKKGDLHYFTYAGDNSVAPEAAMHLRSEQATVVIDTMNEVKSSGAS
jgi:hypothetical protein